MSSSARGSEARGPARVFAAGFFCLAILAGGTPASARQDVPTLVSEISVEIDGRPAPAAYLDLIPIKVGEAYSPRVVDQVVKQIFQTGLFADVRVERSGGEKAALLFVLVRNLFIRKVNFLGPDVPASLLRKELRSLRMGGIFEEDKLPAAVAEVEGALRGEGCFGAEVVPELARDPEHSTVDLLFRVSSWTTYEIGSLGFEGDVEAPAETLLGRMKSGPGKTYVPSRLESDLQSLVDFYEAQGYRRAEVRLAGEDFDEAAGKVDLRIEIMPQEKIIIAVNGAKVPLSLLSPIWEERIYEEWGLAEGEARILNHLRRKGYLFAKVKGRIVKTDAEMRVIYDVAPGEKYKIDRVGFEGLSAFPPERLKTELAVSEKVLFFALISYDRLFAIPREIELFYQENGFPDVQVGLDLRTSGKSATAIYVVEEGRRQTIQSIRFEGARFFAPETLLAEIASRVQGPYFPPNVRRDVESVENFYLNRGIRGTVVNSRIERAGGDSVSLVYDIEEGRKFRIRNVFITGNEVTRTKVIEKEIRVKRGGEADYSKILETRRRLEGLGIFSDVQVNEVQTDPEGEVLVITVREGERNYVGLGVGMESRSKAGGSLGAMVQDFRPRGTAEYIRTNTFGIGAQFSLILQYSFYERRAVASWTQPYLFGLAMPTTVLGWFEREDRVSFDYDRRGVSLNAVKPLSGNRLFLASLSLTRTETFNVDIPDPDLDIDRRLQPYSAALISLSMVWDKRDDTLNPERGYFFSVQGEWGYPVFGMESDYVKSFVKVQAFRNVLSWLNFGLTARLGVGSGLKKPAERFFAGGSNSFRGEEFDRLGPLDPETLKPVGGEAVFILNGETKFTLIPSWKAFSLVAFFDLGNVTERLDDFRPFRLEGAAGGGIKYRTPLGPVRLEIAWKLWPFDANDKRGKPLIFLTIGNVF
jgi:outer membrane protein insertion porin family